MTLGVRHVAVAITAILHAVSGILLSVLSLCLQVLLPSLKQLPPSFDHSSNPAEPPKQHFLSRRDSGHSVHSVTSEGVSSDESYETPSSTLESDPKDSPEKRATVLLASQARARAARPSLFSLSDSLWTLRENPSPMPSQLGEECGATISTDIPHDILYDSPSSASLRSCTPPQEEHDPEAPSPPLKRSRSNLCLSRFPLPRKGSHTLSLPLPGLSRRKSSSSPHLREAATPSRKESDSGDHNHNHRHTSVSGHARKIVEITPVRKCKGRKRKGEKNQPSETASRVDRSRTDPYQAPYFFPSPVSPWAHDYTRLVRLDRKLVFDADGPASSSAPVQTEVDRSRPGERIRSVWAPLHRRGVSPGSDTWR